MDIQSSKRERKISSDTEFNQFRKPAKMPTAVMQDIVFECTVSNEQLLKETRKRFSEKTNSCVYK